MSRRILVAGAAGAIGRRLVPLLVEAGYSVTGTTRSPQKAELLRTLGVEPVVVDVFNAYALAQSLVAARPDVVIHQLTDLPASVDPSKAAEFAARNARIRREGTDNLIRAALASGARRLISQSIAWIYAPGGEPHDEHAALDLDAPAPRRTSVDGVVALETRTLQSPPLTGIVLRYGRIYGPGTGAETASGSISVHVDAAAHAALLAVERGDHGIFNIAEPSAEITSEKAAGMLGWSPAFRLAK
jgi:nucleoside-diphosphate-sugar epimerase